MSTTDKTIAYIRSVEGIGGKSGRGCMMPTITISRQCGAGSSAVARELQRWQSENMPKALPKLTIYGREMVNEIVKEHELGEEVGKYLSDQAPSVLGDAVEELLGLHPGVWNLTQKTAQTVRRLALQGGTILIGRAAHLVAADVPHAIHIRLVAPREFRIEHMRSFKKLSYREAGIYVDRVDQARQLYLSRYFKTHGDAAENFHMVLNTSLLGPEQCAEQIGTLVRKQLAGGK